MWLWMLQRACDIQIAASACGRMRPLPPQVLAQTHRETAGNQPAVCKAAFDAWVRQVDARDPSYRN